MPYNQYDLQLVSLVRELLEHNKLEEAKKVLNNFPNTLQSARTYFNSYIEYQQLDKNLSEEHKKIEGTLAARQQGRQEIENNYKEQLEQLEESMRTSIKKISTDPNSDLKDYLDIHFNTHLTFSSDDHLAPLTGIKKTTDYSKRLSQLSANGFMTAQTVENASPTAIEKARKFIIDFLKEVKDSNPNDRKKLNDQLALVKQMAPTANLVKEIEAVMHLDARDPKIRVDIINATIKNTEETFKKFEMTPAKADLMSRALKQQSNFYSIVNALVKNTEAQIKKYDATDPKVKALTEAQENLKKIQANPTAFRDNVKTFNAAVKKLAEDTASMETSNPLKRVINWIATKIFGKEKIFASKPTEMAQEAKEATSQLNKELEGAERRNKLVNLYAEKLRRGSISYKEAIDSINKELVGTNLPAAETQDIIAKRFKIVSDNASKTMKETLNAQERRDAYLQAAQGFTQQTNTTLTEIQDTIDKLKASKAPAAHLITLLKNYKTHAEETRRKINELIESQPYFASNTFEKLFHELVESEKTTRNKFKQEAQRLGATNLTSADTQLVITITERLNKQIEQTSSLPEPTTKVKEDLTPEELDKMVEEKHKDREEHEKQKQGPTV